jgi:hypothetical protein
VVMRIWELLDRLAFVAWLLALLAVGSYVFA